MYILFAVWNSLCQRDLLREFQRRGYKVDIYSFPRTEENTRLNQELAEKLVRILAEKKYDFVFSFNYFPVISLACNACRIKYVSWTFDSPFIQLYSNTIHFPYNYVFIFDRGTCEDLWKQGVKTVYHLPMAAPTERYDSYRTNVSMHSVYDTELSFVGSTYCEKKHQFYERVVENLTDEYIKGYLEGCIQVQKSLYGSFLLERLITKNILQQIMNAYPIGRNEDGFERPEWVYAHYFLARQVTARERKEVLELLSERHQIDLYTYEKTPELPKVRNRGTAEVYEEAPIIYYCSKINLNISLKSILTGIPLRAMEIMGSGGFLLTNYQEEFLEHFIPNEDFVYYENYEDLKDKVDYYLLHEKERQRIADNGYKKVREGHTYAIRVEEMISVIGE